MNNIEIGKRIKQAREDKAMSQEDLGSQLGLNKSTIQRYESGQVQRIKLPILENMAKVLGVNPSWLVLMSDDPAPALTDQPPLTTDEQDLLNDYRSLNSLGKDEARKRVNELTQINRYKPDDSSDDDEYETVIAVARNGDGKPLILKKKKGKSIFDLPDYRGGGRK